MTRLRRTAADDRLDDFVPIPSAAHDTACAAAAAEGIPVDSWLGQVIRYGGSRERNANLGQARDTTPVAAERALGPVDERAAAAADSPAPRGVATIPIGALRPSSLLPSRRPNAREIRACLAGFARTGRFPPIIVRPGGGAGEGTDRVFEIIAGEPSWRAALQSRCAEMPVAIRDLSDREALIFGLQDALLRRALTPLVEAACYRRLIDVFAVSADTVAAAVGRETAYVSAVARLVDLPDAVQQLIAEGALSLFHARVLHEAPDPEMLAWEVAANGLDIFQTEARVRAAIRQAGRWPPRHGGAA